MLPRARPHRRGHAAGSVERQHGGPRRRAGPRALVRSPAFLAEQAYGYEIHDADAVVADQR